jgi:BirA family transcriptional regulator, biotin operon repressor / biotin---[acetyl-CoA-carboxylase] ligase
MIGRRELDYNSHEAFDTALILRSISADVRELIQRLEAVETVDSTNAQLLARPSIASGRTEILLAENQTAGRGQRGRPWLTKPRGAICLSLSWSFATIPRDIGALSLAVGACVVRALERQGVTEVKLKWPNDLLARGRKLGGILIELRTEASGVTYVVIGIGINVQIDAALAARVASTGIEPIDLHSLASGALSRNAIAASCIEQCVLGLRLFESEGLRLFADEWQRADVLRGQLVSVRDGNAITRGIARGIDLRGALLVETPQGLCRFNSGEVTVRPEG